MFIMKDVEIENQQEYETKKNNMLASIYKNNGFWVSQYIMKTEANRTNSSDSLIEPPVSKDGLNDYNYVTVSQAQNLANNLNIENKTSSLMFGIQWDLMLKYIEKSKSNAENASILNIYDLSGKYGPNGRIVGELLANVICYHHGGLPDAEDFNGDSPLLMRLQDENRLTDYEQVKVAFFKDLQITEQEIEQLFKKSVEEIKLLILKSSTGSEAKNKRKSNFVYLSVHPTN